MIHGWSALHASALVLAAVGTGLLLAAEMLRRGDRAACLFANVTDER